MRRLQLVDGMLLATVLLWAFNFTVTKYVITHGFHPLAYSSVRYGGNSLDILTAKGQFCASFNFGKAVSADYSCNPDFNIAQVGVVTRWTPVKNLTFSAEVGAFFLYQKFTGAATLAATAPKPTTVYEFKDQSTVFLNVRAQRNF